MLTSQNEPITAQLRRLLSRPPSTLLKASAPELCAALPLLVRFFDEHDGLALRLKHLEDYVQRPRA
jgi:hypothetical protein